MLVQRGRFGVMNLNTCPLTLDRNTTFKNDNEERAGIRIKSGLVELLQKVVKYIKQISLS